MMRAALTAVALLFVATGAGIQNLPQFRSMTTRVGVDVSVLAGNVPVAGLDLTAGSAEPVTVIALLEGSPK